jgi:hypothetical protein
MASKKGGTKIFFVESFAPIGIAGSNAIRRGRFGNGWLAGQWSGIHFVNGAGGSREGGDQNQYRHDDADGEFKDDAEESAFGGAPADLEGLEGVATAEEFECGGADEAADADADDGEDEGEEEAADDSTGDAAEECADGGAASTAGAAGGGATGGEFDYLGDEAEEDEGDEGFVAESLLMGGEGENGGGGGHDP